MTKYTLIIALYLCPILLFGQSEAVLDTFKTINPNTLLVSEITYLDKGTKDIKVIALLINEERFPVPDTTIVLSESDVRSTYYLKKNGEHIFYTKLSGGGRYESHRTGYRVNKEDQINVLKCIYSKIKYPERAIARDLQGRIELEFYLNTSGCIQDILPRGYAHEILLLEAKRAAKDCDCTFPVLLKEENKFPTRVLLPISFKLE